MKYIVKDIYVLHVHWCKEGLGSGTSPPPLLLVRDRSSFPPHTFTPEYPDTSEYPEYPEWHVSISTHPLMISSVQKYSPLWTVPSLRSGQILQFLVFPNLLAECLFPNVLLERDWVWCGIWRQLQSAEEQLNIHGQYEGIAPNNITHKASAGLPTMQGERY